MRPSKQALLAILGGYLMSALWRVRSRVSAQRLRAAEYRTSAQALGISFTERMRDTFRFRWIRRP